MATIEEVRRWTQAVQRNMLARQGGPRITEDDPRWNPMTMGNRQFGGARGIPKVTANQVRPQARRAVGRRLMQQQPRDMGSLLKLIAEVYKRRGL